MASCTRSSAGPPGYGLWARTESIRCRPRLFLIGARSPRRRVSGGTAPAGMGQHRDEDDRAPGASRHGLGLGHSGLRVVVQTRRTPGVSSIRCSERFALRMCDRPEGSCVLLWCDRTVRDRPPRFSGLAPENTALSAPEATLLSTTSGRPPVLYLSPSAAPGVERGVSAIPILSSGAQVDLRRRRRCYIEVIVSRFITR